MSKPRDVGVADERDWMYVRRDGTLVPVRASTTAIRDARGRVTGYLVIANSIGDQKLAEERRRVDPVDDVGA